MIKEGMLMIDERIILYMMSCLYSHYHVHVYYTEGLGTKSLSAHVNHVVTLPPQPLGCETKENYGLKPEAFPSKMGN